MAGYPHHRLKVFDAGFKFVNSRCSRRQRIPPYFRPILFYSKSCLEPVHLIFAFLDLHHKFRAHILPVRILCFKQCPELVNLVRVIHFFSSAIKSSTFTPFLRSWAVNSQSSTSPLIPVVLPKIPVTSPMIPETLPQIPVTSPMIPETLPQIPVTLPMIPETLPQIPVTSPISHETSPMSPVTSPLI